MPISRARRLLHLARVRGARRTARAFAQGYLFAFRRWYIFYRPIRPAAPQPAGAEFEYRLATAADLDSFAVFEPNRHRREFREWLDDGALLFAAFKDGRPVAFQCFARSVPTGPPLNRLTLGSGQIWTVDVQTVPEYRRHHVAADLRAYRDIMLSEMGLREYVSSVQDDNLPALRYAYGNPKRLVDRVQLLTYFCLLGWRRVSIEADSLARLERVLAESERSAGTRS
jgi:hypothetical protein